MKRKIPVPLIGACLGIALISLFSACEENTNNPSITQDAAESIAGNLAYSTGGMIDQLVDLSSFATSDGMDKLEQKYPRDYFVFTKTYDIDTEEWSIHIERERGTAGLIPYAFVSRDYTLKFLNSTGQAQQYYITGADTARTIQFNIVQGQGRHVTRRLSQQLNEVNANWTLTNAHQNIITINGDYYRAAVDTIRTFFRVRTSDHYLEFNLTDLIMPRGSGPGIVNAISGQITGHFHADITFTSGTSYSEHTIDRYFDIQIGGGQADIDIGNATFRANILSGELIE
ncbi:MAG: hypothetical protein FJ042_04035 [Candidatus Cloacimonetes bacterium]|nr:hypothetical protein [Candidatus Cloacimonadota bacterium]